MWHPKPCSLILSTLVCFTLLTSCFAANEQCKFELISSKELVRGQPVEGWLNWNCPLDDVTISLRHHGAKLDAALVTQTLSNLQTTSSQSFSLDAASVTGDLSDKTSLSLCASGDEFDHCKDVKFVAASNILMFQLIKPIFKPGDNFKAQIACFDRDMQMCESEPVSCYILTPTSIKMNVQNFTIGTGNNEVGVGLFKFPIDQKPLLGDYMFKCELDPDASIPQVFSQSFTIDEYVPPRFEVTCSLDSGSEVIIETQRKDITGSCNVDYTFGEAVNAIVNINCYKNAAGSPIYSENSLDAPVTMGRHPFTIHKSKTSGLYNGNELVCLVNATEASGTGLWQSAQVRLDVVLNPVLLDCCDSGSCPKVVKPDQYCGCVSAKNADKSLIDASYKTDNYKLEVLLNACGKEPLRKEILGSKLKDRNYFCFDVAAVESADDEEDDDPPNNELDEEGDDENDIEMKMSFWTIPDNNGCRERDFSLTSKFVEMVGSSEHVRSNYWSKSLDDFHSINDSYIQIRIINGSETFTPNAMGSVSLVSTCDTLDSVTYVIKSRGLWQHGESVSVSSFPYTLDFMVTYDMSPSFNLYVSGICDSEVINDMLTITVDKDAQFLKNHVSLSLNKPAGESYLPGDTATLNIDTAPDSYVAVVAMDKRIQVLAGSKNMPTAEDVVMKLFELTSTEDNDDADDEDGCVGCFFWFPRPSSSKDATGVLKDAGLITIVKNYEVPEHYEDIWYRGMMIPEMIQFDGAGGGRGVIRPLFFRPKKEKALPLPVPKGLDREEKTLSIDPRTKFLENIIFKIFDYGQFSDNFNVGDTITTHFINAFAMSPTLGAGFMKDFLELVVFKDTFVMVHSPYAVKRQESFLLTSTVCNYKSQDITVSIEVDFDPDQFIAVEFDSNGRKFFPDIPEHADPSALTSCYYSDIVLSPQECATEKCPLKVAQVGKKKINVTVIEQTEDIVLDMVVKEINCKPEGCESLIPGDRVKLTGESADSFNFVCYNLSIPSNAVDQSGIRHVRLYTALNNAVLANLGNLVRMPTGCGEQTMISLAPMIYVKDNIEATGQSIGDDKEQQLMMYMTQGYQRELTYEHDGGGFSAFGESDSSPSTWLTAFVVKAFSEASNYIYVDPAKIRDSADWLLDHVQKPNGSMPEVGNVCHKEMQGGAAGGAPLTALVVMSLSKLPNADFNNRKDAIEKSKDLIEMTSVEIDQSSDSYLLGLTCNALFNYYSQIPGEDAQQKISEYATKLLGLKVTTDDGVYWPKEVGSESPSDDCHCHSFGSSARSIDVETTSYALGCLIRADTDVVLTNSVVDWLRKKQSPSGSYSSTQDTITALWALALYAEGAVDTDMAVKVNRGSEVVAEFDLHQSEEMFLYEFLDLAKESDSGNGVEIIGDDEQACVEATGPGRLYVASELYLNFPQCPSPDFSNITVTTLNILVTESKVVVQVCVEYSGAIDEDGTGMAVVQIDPFSGFSFNCGGLGGIQEVSDLTGFKRQDVEETGALSIYLDQFLNEQLCFEVTSCKVEDIGGQQPAVINAFLYYNAEEQKRVEYSAQALMDTSIVGECVGCNSLGQTNAADCLKEFSFTFLIAFCILKAFFNF